MKYVCATCKDMRLVLRFGSAHPRPHYEACPDCADPNTLADEALLHPHKPGEKPVPPWAVKLRATTNPVELRAEVSRLRAILDRIKSQMQATQRVLDIVRHSSTKPRERSLLYDCIGDSTNDTLWLIEALEGGSNGPTT
jgi:hypothetical protein